MARALLSLMARIHHEGPSASDRFVLVDADLDVDRFGMTEWCNLAVELCQAAVIDFGSDFHNASRATVPRFRYLAHQVDSQRS